jgi:hypothetical protein
MTAVTSDSAGRKRSGGGEDRGPVRRQYGQHKKKFEQTAVLVYHIVSATEDFAVRLGLA